MAIPLPASPIRATIGHRTTRIVAKFEVGVSLSQALPINWPLNSQGPLSLKQLPDSATLEQLRKQAKDLLEHLFQGQLPAVETVGLYFPVDKSVGMNEVQFVLAKEYGFASWKELREHIRERSRSAEG